MTYNTTRLNLIVKCSLPALLLIVPRVSQAEIIAYVANPDSETNGDRPFVALLSENDWFGAEREARRWGGHLISIHDQAMNDWVNQTFSQFEGTDRSLWIGLNDVANEGEFVWTDGSTSNYRNWFRSEPNNTGGNEDSVLMLPFGEWNDADGSLRIGFGVAVVAVIPEARTVTSVFVVCLLMAGCRARRWWREAA